TATGVEMCFKEMCFKEDKDSWIGTVQGQAAVRSSQHFSKMSPATNAPGKRSRTRSFPEISIHPSPQRVNDRPGKAHQLVQSQYRAPVFYAVQIAYLDSLSKVHAI